MDYLKAIQGYFFFPQILSLIPSAHCKWPVLGKLLGFLVCLLLDTVTFISCWKVSQGDVIHCLRPSMGRKYQFFKDIYLGLVFTIK